MKTTGYVQAEVERILGAAASPVADAPSEAGAFLRWLNDSMDQEAHMNDELRRHVHVSRTDTGERRLHRLRWSVLPQTSTERPRLQYFDDASEKISEHRWRDVPIHVDFG